MTSAPNIDLLRDLSARALDLIEGYGLDVFRLSVDALDEYPPVGTKPYVPVARGTILLHLRNGVDVVDQVAEALDDSPTTVTGNGYLVRVCRIDVGLELPAQIEIQCSTAEPAVTS